MSRGIRAFAAGVFLTLRAPLLIATLAMVTLLTLLPFAIVLGGRLREALGHQPPINLDAEEIDAEWWAEYRAHARGLEATFTPAIIGFAAPLDNLSALADGTPRPLVAYLPVALYAVVWAFVWGGLVRRFDAGRAIGVRAFCRAGLRSLPRFLAVALLAAVAILGLYLTVHALLLGPVFEWGAARAGSERNAFVWRVILYAGFAVLLAAVGQIADYTRIASAAGGVGTLPQALRASVAFVRANAAAVVTVAGMSLVVFILLLGLYAIADRRFGGWRGVVLGQAYIVARLALRLSVIAAQVQLFRRGAVQATSVVPVNPGPPAAT